MHIYIYINFFLPIYKYIFSIQNIIIILIGRTFIRGQNAPLEAEVLMERERKRQKALEHQNAIRLQVTNYNVMK
jgi:hypothetical protein